MSQPITSDALVDTYRALLNARLADKPTTKTRGPAGIVGTGTPGRRLKRSCPDGMSLKAYARSLASMRASHPTGAIDAERWFASKRGR